MADLMTKERIAELREWNRGGADEMTEALDEIDRLRAALYGIAQHGDDCRHLNAQRCGEDAAMTARAALEGK